MVKTKRLKDWFNLAENRDRSQGVVSTVMNRQIPHSFGNLLTGWGTYLLTNDSDSNEL